MKKHSVRIKGHNTSISLEEAFWVHLKTISDQKDISMNQLVGQIDARRTNANLSSALRLYVLKHLEDQISNTATAQERL